MQRSCATMAVELNAPMLQHDWEEVVHPKV